ncbi:hypothetical protein HYFRA_00012107 [Hymenoscyphus fraxineus]|uniref:Uncharacterized protein n=1 Tax=Hymenoscyphus fraxineus TaxID=746836 RepID=A0A9N9L1X6_9HELO|nr:hypothetical protein HYFRA_00012107 [Hymenoscyphus fraxineus]
MKSQSRRHESIPPNFFRQSSSELSTVLPVQVHPLKMTRYKKAANAKGNQRGGVLAQTAANIQQPDFQQNEPRKRGRPKKQEVKPTEIFINLAEESDDDHEESQPQSALTCRLPNPSKLFENLGYSAVEFLDGMKSGRSVNAFLASAGLESDDERIDQLEELCGTISQMLRSRRAPKLKVKTTMCAPGSLLPIHSFFVHRAAGNVLTLAAPLEIFKASASIKSKTFGFVRELGNYPPLMCACSGIHDLFKDQKKILDSTIWTREVFHLATYRDHKMKSNGYETHKGLPKGYTFCSHVEPKLMLWFACRWLIKVSDQSFSSIRKQVANIWRINQKGMPTPPKAEVVIDRLPCKSCRDIRGLIEEMTGIKYYFHYIPKVGNVYLEKDAYGNQVFPLCADEGDILSSEDEVDEEEELAIRRQAQISFPQKVTAPKSAIQELPEVHVKESTVTKISKWSYNAPATPPTTPLKSRWRPDRQPYIEEVEDEDEDELYTPLRKRPASKIDRNKSGKKRKQANQASSSPAPKKHHARQPTYFP